MPGYEDLSQVQRPGQELRERFRDGQETKFKLLTLNSSHHIEWIKCKKFKMTHGSFSLWPGDSKGLHWANYDSKWEESPSTPSKVLPYSINAQSGHYQRRRSRLLSKDDSNGRFQRIQSRSSEISFQWVKQGWKRRSALPQSQLHCSLKFHQSNQNKSYWTNWYGPLDLTSKLSLIHIWRCRRRG